MSIISQTDQNIMELLAKVSSLEGQVVALQASEAKLTVEKKLRKKAVNISKLEVAPVKSRRGKKMSDTEKKSLSDHMGTREGTPTEVRSHFWEVKSRMRKGMSIEDALKDIA